MTTPLGLTDLTEQRRATLRSRRRDEVVGRTRRASYSARDAVVRMAMRYGSAQHRLGLAHGGDYRDREHDALVAYFDRASARRFRALQRLAGCLIDDGPLQRVRPPGVIVWAATRRVGLDFHQLDAWDSPATTCGRSTASATSVRFDRDDAVAGGMKPCPRCYSDNSVGHDEGTQR